jgi:eukaryotic-like serine/threonine-protein kinase
VNFWKKILILISGFIVIILLMNFIVMPWYVRHDTLVKVPSLTGLSYEAALKLLDENDLEGKQGDIRYDPSKPIGTVIEQNPPAEQMVKSGRRIYLIVSGGEQLYEVPNLIGRSVREARFNLGQRNLDLQEISTKQSAQYPSGIVIEQIEQTGTKVKKGTKIGVVVSIGMESGSIKVPDLIGKNVEEAKKLLLQSKLQIGKITAQPSDNVPLNSVIDQYPRPNSMANENDKIDIFVNKEKKKKEVIEENLDEKDKENKENDVNKDKETDKEKPKETDKEKKPEIKKEKEKEKDDKSKTPDKKEEKKKVEPPKEKEPKKEDKEGTKF